MGQLGSLCPQGCCWLHGVPSVPPPSRIDPFSLFSLQVFGPNCPHRRGTILHPSVSPSTGGDTPSGVFGDRGCTSTSRTEGTRWGELGTDPRERERGVGAGVVPQFPHFREGPGAVPPAATGGQHVRTSPLSPDG